MIGESYAVRVLNESIDATLFCAEHEYADKIVRCSGVFVPNRM